LFGYGLLSFFFSPFSILSPKSMGVTVHFGSFPPVCTIGPAPRWNAEIYLFKPLLVFDPLPHFSFCRKLSDFPERMSFHSAPLFSCIYSSWIFIPQEPSLPRCRPRPSHVFRFPLTRLGPVFSPPPHRVPIKLASPCPLTSPARNVLSPLIVEDFMRRVGKPLLDDFR